MPDIQFLLAAVLAVTLNVYVVLAGADFGGGVWDLFASGEGAARQRAIIARTLAPVWEANHVWLVIAIVILFTGFPLAFGTIATALHIPLTLALVGIVLRGAAFVFRAYGSANDAVERHWGRVFAIASLLTPLLLGMVVGALTEGQIRIANGRVANLFHTWLTPFAMLVGLFTLTLFGFLAAVYLTLEADSAPEAEAFRQRALVSGVGVALAALAVFIASSRTPSLRAALLQSAWALPLHVATGGCATMTFVFLYRRAFHWARWTAAAQVTLIFWGWALAQWPFLVRPDVSVYTAAAPAATIRLLLTLLGVGATLLLPALIYLFSVFGPARHP